jgi:hypothetical protein
MEDVTQKNSDTIERESALADDAVPVCPNCLEPCNPLDNYCPNCGSNETINPLASYMPFVDLRFRIGMIGKLWRRTWSSDTEWIDRAIYIGLFILFYPVVLLIGLPYLLYEQIKRKKEKSAFHRGSE